MTLKSEPGTLTYALTQSRLDRQACERSERIYEDGLYRRYVVSEGDPLDLMHQASWYEYDRCVDAEQAVAAWERVAAWYRRFEHVLPVVDFFLKDDELEDEHPVRKALAELTRLIADAIEEKEAAKPADSYGLAVKDIMLDIGDRRGLRQAFEAIDDETHDEIVNAWMAILRARLGVDQADALKVEEKEGADAVPKD